MVDVCGAVVVAVGCWVPIVDSPSLVVASWVLIVGCLLLCCLLVAYVCCFSVVVVVVALLVFLWHDVRHIKVCARIFRSTFKALRSYVSRLIATYYWIGLTIG